MEDKEEEERQEGMMEENEMRRRGGEEQEKAGGANPAWHCPPPRCPAHMEACPGGTTLLLAHENFLWAWCNPSYLGS